MREAGLKRILVAMSGGVDSSVAVRLLQEQGYYAAGATMVMLENDEDRVARTKVLRASLESNFLCFMWRICLKSR